MSTVVTIPGVEVKSTRGQIRVMTPWQINQPISLVTTEGAIDLRLRGESSGQSTTWPVECGRRQEGQRPVSRAHRRLAGDWPLWPARANPGG